MPASHMCNAFSLEADDDDFYNAICSCGWSVGPFVDVEDVVDALMDHAYDQGRLRA